MFPCDDYANWDVSVELDGDQPEHWEKWKDEERDRRTGYLRDAINAYLEANNYDPVNVTHGSLRRPDGKTSAGDTNRVTGDITFDDDYLLFAGRGRDDAYQTAFHETFHSMNVQDRLFDMLSDDEMGAMNDFKSMEGFSDEDPGHEMPEHQDAKTFGKHMSDIIKEECGDDKPKPPTGAYSPSDEMEVEILWDDIVVSDADETLDDDAELEADDPLDAYDELEAELEADDVYDELEAELEADETLDEADIVERLTKWESDWGNIEVSAGTDTLDDDDEGVATETLGAIYIDV